MNNNNTYIYNLPLFVFVESDRGDLQADELYELVCEQLGRHLDAVSLTVNDIDFERVTMDVEEL